MVLLLKNLPANVGDVREAGSNPGLGGSPGGGMATHLGVLIQRIPQTEEAGRLQPMGLQRVGHDQSDLGFPGGSEDKASDCKAGDLGSIPGLGRSPGEENGNPLQYSCLENPMDRGAWRATVHRVTKSQT